MSKDGAIELMKTAKNVDDWNEKRERVKWSTPHKELQGTLGHIDGSGLIVQVLGRDKQFLSLAGE